MAINVIRFEGFWRSQSHSWDQAYASCQKRMLGLSDAFYIDQIFARFSMQDSKKGFIPFIFGISLSSDQCPKNHAEIERMRGIPYASAVESLMYAMLCTRSTSALSLAWLADISLIMEKNTGQR